ncbi:MAG TPA: class I SAM-dependent methyltransferase [Gaiella sp.]|nr:class I SAM-dependent methyltransferase [Gaiella sp.]
MTDPRMALVAAGYDAMIDTWEAWKAGITDDPRAAWCDELVARLPRDARVVELGCGGGTDETRILAERFRLTGIDLSVEQLRRARERVPGAEFVHGDITELELDSASVDAVAAFYVLNHVPRELLAGLFARVHRWLVPGGLFLATLGATDLPGWTGEWLGQPTYFAGFAPTENRRLLAQAGLALERDEFVTIHEPAGEATFHWVLATR